MFVYTARNIDIRLQFIVYFSIIFQIAKKVNDYNTNTFYVRFINTSNFGRVNYKIFKTHVY